MLHLELVALCEQRDQLPENEFMEKLFDFCFKLTSGLQVIFDLEIPRKTEDGLVEELRSRLEKAGILTSNESACQLVIQSPLVASGPISARDTEYNRYPFNISGYKGKQFLEVDPTGRPFLAKPFNLTASVIEKVSVSSDKNLPLSPALSQFGEPIVISEWRLPDHLLK